MASDLGDILRVRRRSTILSIRGFIDNTEPKKTDRQLGECLESAVTTQESEIKLRGHRAYIYEEQEFSAVPGPADIAIQEQYKQLNEQCIEFQRHLIEKEQEAQRSGRKKRGMRNLLRRVNKAEPKNSMIEQEERGTQNPPPTTKLNTADSFAQDIENVREAVVYVKQEWEKKPRLFNGQVQGCFEKCCTTLNDHIGLLSMLPEQNQYFSILCGGIKMIIKASVNHRRIAVDFGEAIERVNSDIEDCAEVRRLWQHSELQLMVSKLYGLIFYFLTCAMKWYQSRSIKKALDSFNESFRDSFKNTLAAIDYLKGSIFRKASYKSQAQVQLIDARLVEALNRIEDLDSRVFNAFRGFQEQYQKEQEERAALKKQFAIGENLQEPFNKLLELITGRDTMGLLGANQEAYGYEITDERQVAIVRQSTFSETTEKKKVPKTLGSPKTYMRDDLQMWSGGLETHTTSMMHFLEPQDIRVDRNVAIALEDWIRGTTSKSLWVRDSESTSPLAAAVAMKALEVGMPLLCFFCDCTDPTQDPEKEIYLSSKDRDIINESVVINLAYSLIRQIINLLPNRFETKLKFSKSGFAKLDGTLDTWKDAMRILDKLMKLAPQGMLAVIDGLEQLDLTDYHDCIEEILGVLLKYVTQDRRTFKILLTTVGSCRMIEMYDNVDMVAPRPVKAKHRNRGRRFLDFP